jgi:hypothetical protein
MHMLAPLRRVQTADSFPEMATWGRAGFPRPQVRARLSWPGRAALLHAPELEIPGLKVVAGDEDAVGATLDLDILSGD